MRALRVIRLFGRVKELRKMITAVSASIFAMMNAFVILVIMLCICKPPVLSPSLHFASFFTSIFLHETARFPLPSVMLNVLVYSNSPRSACRHPVTQRAPTLSLSVHAIVSDKAGRTTR